MSARVASSIDSMTRKLLGHDRFRWIRDGCFVKRAGHRRSVRASKPPTEFSPRRAPPDVAALRRRGYPGRRQKLFCLSRDVGLRVSVAFRSSGKRGSMARIPTRFRVVVDRVSSEHFLRIHRENVVWQGFRGIAVFSMKINMDVWTSN
jgi:hypothetical protein